MAFFQAYVVLKGLNGRTLRKVYDLGEFNDLDPGDQYNGAHGAYTQIVGALDTVTDGVIVGSGIISAILDDAGLPGAGDLFENAMVNVYTLDEDDPTAVEHVSQIFIPAPVIGIFSAPTGALRDVVDVTDADLTQYVQQLSQHAYVSDGETIQTASGDDGMLNGRRVIRKVRLGL
jgi:hypothetical protein